MDDVRRSLGDLARHLRRAGAAGLSAQGPSLAASLEQTVAAARAVGVEASAGDLPALLRAAPRLGESDRELLAARLQRIAATLGAHLAALAPPEPEPPRPEGPTRAERTAAPGDPLSRPVRTVR